MSQALKKQWLWNTVFSKRGYNKHLLSHILFYRHPERGGLHHLPLKLRELVIHFNQKNKAHMILLDFWGNQLLPCAGERAFGVLSCCVRSPTTQRHHALMRTQTRQKDHMQCLVNSLSPSPPGQHRLPNVCSKKPTDDRGLRRLRLPSWETRHHGAETSSFHCALPKFQTKKSMSIIKQLFQATKFWSNLLHSNSNWNRDELKCVPSIQEIIFWGAGIQ